MALNKSMLNEVEWGGRVIKETTIRWVLLNIRFGQRTIRGSNSELDDGDGSEIGLVSIVSGLTDMFVMSSGRSRAI